MIDSYYGKKIEKLVKKWKICTAVSETDTHNKWNQTYCAF